MAIFNPNNYTHMGMDNFDFKVRDYPIGGKMVRVSASMSNEYKMLAMTDMQAREQIREHLVTQLVEFILQNKLCEITQTSDPMSGGSIVYARMYLAPDDNIKILRTVAK